MGELVDAGDLRVLEAFGREHLIVGVTWTPAGEGTFRAVVAPLAPRTVPTFTVVGAVDTSPPPSRTASAGSSRVEGVRWCSVITADSRVIGARGGASRTSHHLAEAGNRMLAILRSLEDQHATGFVRLRFEEDALVGASLGRHALVACGRLGRRRRPGRDDRRGPGDPGRPRPVRGPDGRRPAEVRMRPRSRRPSSPHRCQPAPLVGARFGGAASASGRTRRRTRFGSR